MADFFLGGRVIDAIIGLAALEALAVCGWRAATGRGPEPLTHAVNVLAGAFLLLALRFALGGDAGPRIALCLSGALVAHLADLRARWEGARPDPRRAPPPPLKATISLRVAKSGPRAAPPSREDGPPGA
jgi:hypothetical protein